MNASAPVLLNNIWFYPNGANVLWAFILGGLVLGIGAMFALTKVPPRGRTAIITTITFMSGLFYVMFFLWPRPVGRDPGTMPADMNDQVGFFLEDSIQRVADFSTILAGFLLGLGAYSVIRIHGRKIVRQQPDWGFSVVLFASMITMIVLGYWDFGTRIAAHGALEARENWTFVNYGFDLVFDGFLQNMDAAMFSLIAFYILSAAYRAFRVRSIEATILLGAALVMILGLMGWVGYQSDQIVGNLTNHDPNSFWNSLKLSGIADWLRFNVQTSSLRGIDFGVGIGLLAMGLRLWLSLERVGGTSNA